MIFKEDFLLHGFRVFNSSVLRVLRRSCTHSGPTLTEEFKSQEHGPNEVRSGL